MTSSQRPSVDMRCVWLVKSPDDSSKYEQCVQSAGCKPVTVSALSFTFINEAALHDALSRADDHVGLVFTSPRAVEAVGRSYHKLTADEQTVWKAKKSFAVGQTTAKLVQEKLGLSAIGGHTGNSQQLAQFIIETVPAFEKPLLFPCGNLKKEDLPRLLAQQERDFRALTCYQTSCDPSIKRNIERALSDSCSPDIVVFFSPSGVEFTVPVLARVVQLSRVKFVALGASTNAALVAAKLPVSGVCDTPTAEALQHVLQGLP